MINHQINDVVKITELMRLLVSEFQLKFKNKKCQKSDVSVYGANLLTLQSND